MLKCTHLEFFYNYSLKMCDALVKVNEALPSVSEIDFIFSLFVCVQAY
jgi:hypothetical protein